MLLAVLLEELLVVLALVDVVLLVLVDVGRYVISVTYSRGQ